MQERVDLPSDYRKIYPEWIAYYERGLSQLEEMRPTENPDTNAFEVFGDEIIHYTEGLAEMRVGDNGTVLQRRLPGLKEEWNSSGLINPTIFPVIQEILIAHGLWKDEVIKPLVLTHLRERLDFGLIDIQWMEKYFYDQLLVSSIPDIEKTVDFIGHLAHVAQEMSVKRWIDIAQLISLLQQSGISHMASEQWREFLNTQKGRRLGIFSTVEWLTEPIQTKPESPRFKVMSQRQAMVSKALSHYQENQAYQEFTDRPFEIIAEDVDDFIAQRS